MSNKLTGTHIAAHLQNTDFVTEIEAPASARINQQGRVTMDYIYT
jgi:hypothetical protein